MNDFQPQPQILDIIEADFVDDDGNLVRKPEYVHIVHPATPHVNNSVIDGVIDDINALSNRFPQNTDLLAHHGEQTTRISVYDLVATLYLRGRTTDQIAETLQKPIEEIANILQHVKNEWRQQRNENIVDIASEELQHLRRVRAEAWEAWYFSGNPNVSYNSVTERIPRITDDEFRALAGPAIGKTFTKVSVDNSKRDSRYLKVIIECTKMIDKLLGISPEEVKRVIIDDGRGISTITTQELEGRPIEELTELLNREVKALQERQRKQ